MYDTMMQIIVPINHTQQEQFTKTLFENINLGFLQKWLKTQNQTQNQLINFLEFSFVLFILKYQIIHKNTITFYLLFFFFLK